MDSAPSRGVISRRLLGDTAKSVLNVSLTSGQLQGFERYAQALVDWNQRVNLTAITAPGEVEIKHFIDSLTCLLVMDLRPGQNLIDIGTGAGFPGLPLKIVRPDLRLVLVEATAKKAAFCRHVVENLRLEGVEILHARAETVGADPNHREAYDWAVARAVAPLAVLSEYLLPLVKIGGRVVAQKGEAGPAEAHAAEAAIRRLGGRVVQLKRLELPKVAETRYLVLIDKVAATPDGLPRRPGIPSKRPLSDA
jgi:16S rRNA (guanine527-N7)-methyltransferase